MDQVFYCLLGPAGVGKSFICGLVAEAFGRPFININIGKAEASDLVGSDPTYRGSTYGKIVGGMIEHQHRAPVILLDEFEKVRKDEITNMISIITDKSKNATDFDDSYFGYTVPLNKCFILLTGNDRSKVPQFLDSRVVYVELKPYTYEQRLAIVKQELEKSLKLFELERYLGSFSDEILEKCITETWGVRQSKENAQGLARQLAEMEIDGEVPGDFESYEWSFVGAKDEDFDKGVIED
jgi:ATP-dependent Lon protease